MTIEKNLRPLIFRSHLNPHKKTIQKGMGMKTIKGIISIILALCMLPGGIYLWWVVIIRRIIAAEAVNRFANDLATTMIG